MNMKEKHLFKIEVFVTNVINFFYEFNVYLLNKSIYFFKKKNSYIDILSCPCFETRFYLFV